jgi:hypothetical protein
MDMNLDDFPDWVKQRVLENEKQEERNKFVEWGKLGGRPKKDIKKSERLTIRFTPDEMKFLKEKSEKNDISLTDYSRIILLNKTIPDKEKNLQLIKYENNFRRISNMFQMGIFNSEEKEYFLEELESTIKEIRNAINWDQ